KASGPLQRGQSLVVLAQSLERHTQVVMAHGQLVSELRVLRKVGDQFLQQLNGFAEISQGFFPSAQVTTDQSEIDARHGYLLAAGSVPGALGLEGEKHGQGLAAGSLRLGGLSALVIDDAQDAQTRGHLLPIQGETATIRGRVGREVRYQALEDGQFL